MIQPPNVIAPWISHSVEGKDIRGAREEDEEDGTSNRHLSRRDHVCSLSQQHVVLGLITKARLGIAEARAAAAEAMVEAVAAQDTIICIQIKGFEQGIQSRVFMVVFNQRISNHGIQARFSNHGNPLKVFNQRFSIKVFKSMVFVVTPQAGGPDRRPVGRNSPEA
ncbi:hypothetical protein E3N88_10294 [Mikania micrantha]|uniref:Uncharacterized protein n=1 Tax=Mikania micrantha TaxID=192012 RepID=A0A5N6PAD8_9ASTR|nr:hypothetical protein E3N88_10294 [Mikania micrantha]